MAAILAELRSGARNNKTPDLTPQSRDRRQTGTRTQAKGSKTSIHIIHNLDNNPVSVTGKVIQENVQTPSVRNDVLQKRERMCFSIT